MRLFHIARIGTVLALLTLFFMAHCKGTSEKEERLETLDGGISEGEFFGDLEWILPEMKNPCKSNEDCQSGERCASLHFGACAFGPCTTDKDCKGRFQIRCLTGKHFPNGMCVMGCYDDRWCMVDVNENTDCVACPAGADCKDLGEIRPPGTICLPTCKTSKDCRAGYKCLPNGSGGSVCKTWDCASPGDKSCKDVSTLRECQADNTWKETACGAGQKCVNGSCK